MIAVAAYKSTFPGELIGYYDVLAYDAATALIRSAARVVADDGTCSADRRADVIRALDAHSASSTAGTLSFDEHGDAEFPTFVVHQVTGREWRPVYLGGLDR